MTNFIVTSTSPAASIPNKRVRFLAADTLTGAYNSFTRLYWSELLLDVRKATDAEVAANLRAQQGDSRPNEF
jgi:hypothetical protein